MILPHHHFLKRNKLWYQQLMKQISHLSTKATTEKYENTLKLKDEIITAELKMLLNKIIVVTIEKARSNNAFVWQKHYAQVLINKFSLNHVKNTNSRYTKANKPVDIIASVTSSFLKNKFNVEVADINKKTP